jgi:hypothetical protein
MYEERNEPLITRRSFVIRVLGHLLLAVTLISLGLGIGVLGYHHLCGLGWLDSILNASMILGGMGPVDPLVTPSAKLFASFYALFSGLAFVGIASLIVAPFAHRLVHRLHLDEE